MKKLIDDFSTEYGLGQAELESNLGKPLVNVAIDGFKSGFIAGINYQKEYYTNEINLISQKVLKYQTQLAEWLGGVYYGNK